MVDFFNQISDFLQWFWDLMKEGITNVGELPKLFNQVSEHLNKALDFVHPAFIPLLSFCVVSALLLRFLRLD